VQVAFYRQLEFVLSPERMAAYAGDHAEGVSPQCLGLARYLLNMALCESLYGSLQMCEVGLRNAIHRELTKLYGREDWYECDSFNLTNWAQGEVTKAKAQITKEGKPITPGRVIAEMSFGFWTSLFESHYEQQTLFLPAGIKGVFPHLPKRQHRRKERKADLENIRQLRNRVFHHERIIHWKDLDSRHQQVHAVIGWFSPSLQHMAQKVDRFAELRKAGLKPWIDLIQANWPEVGDAGLSGCGGSRLGL
jgi:hypothetical protein